ncbi:MAG: hypothetical protein KA155_04735 [Alphaproteobacteria bacterium]|jgi:hypothetical protein|nr:hypothetical protein [Alphaproteobacteria bacterium]
MEKHTHTDLPAILAGTTVALAISIIFVHFGSVIGLSMTTEAEWNPETVAGQVITICLWMLWIQLLASLIGGYITGRMRVSDPGATPHEREMRDGIHGLAVWAFGTVLVAIAAGFAAAITALVPEAQEEAERTAEILRMNDSAAVIMAFSVAAISLVSAVASWFAATKGGDHRDEGTDLSRIVSFRKS